LKADPNAELSKWGASFASLWVIQVVIVSHVRGA